jgi:L-alanine-DL-glutamate epimerase-like enolase superfamily enzyme
MQITKISAYPLRYPEPNDRNNFRHITLVKIETDNGLVGWGECISQWPEAALAVKVLIEHGLGPVLLGRDPIDNQALFLLLKDHCWWYGDTGLANFAISALDIALWDLKGKALGLPIHKLLGGKIHDRLRACASTHPSQARLEDLARELQAHVAAGYTAVKVGFGKTGEANLGVDPKRDVEYVRIVRETIGDEADFIVDLGKKTRWDRASGIRLSREFEKYRVRWIEDPFAPTNVEAYQHLRRSIQTQVATGEREWTPAGYQRLIELGVADIYLADPGRVQGITGVKQVIEMTSAAHLFFNAHTWSSAINTAAAVHLTATATNYIVFELKPAPSPMQYELVTEPIEQRGGWVTVPDKPGLGVEIVEAAVHKYMFDIDHVSRTRV